MGPHVQAHQASTRHAQADANNQAKSTRATSQYAINFFESRGTIYPLAYWIARQDIDKDTHVTRSFAHNFHEPFNHFEIDSTCSNQGRKSIPTPPSNAVLDIISSITFCPASTCPYP
jgi:hypothetical protein